MQLKRTVAAIAAMSLLIPAFGQVPVTTDQVSTIEKIFDLHFSEAKKDSMLGSLSSRVKTYEFMHSTKINNSVPMSLWFDPVLPSMKLPADQAKMVWDISSSVSMPSNKNDLAFYSILQLASLVKNKKISSVDLTRFFIDRLKKYGPQLHCVIELTENLAMEQARKADADLANGIYKTPLQGIPYGIKDLFAVRGTHTTWGTPPYKNQQIDETCFVAKKLESAGAVLIAKLSLGELAMDDVWFGGMTRNPWNTETGSGGSSAGSGAATAAGLVPFAIGTETYGSIVDPSMRCGVSGLRPTYGSIDRTGAMALSWSSDKIGPLCHSAEDAAIVFSYIHGTDGSDRSAHNAAFNYTGKISISQLKIAYASNYIDSLPENSPEKMALATIRNMGATVTPFSFPDTLHGDEILGLIIGVESAAAFDELTRSNKDDEMVQQANDRWPNIFRSARFVPAVEYVNACRMRQLIMEKMDPVLDQYDIIIAPPETGDQLAITNLTGNPSITIPNGLLKNGMPASISFIGKHFEEANLLAFTKAYQEATGFHLLHPKAFLQ